MKEAHLVVKMGTCLAVSMVDHLAAPKALQKADQKVSQMAVVTVAESEMSWAEWKEAMMAVRKEPLLAALKVAHLATWSVVRKEISMAGSTGCLLVA